MQKINKIGARFNVDMNTMLHLKNNKPFQDYINHELSEHLARNLIDFLSINGEIIASISDVDCYKISDIASFEYQQYIKCARLVHCKDCEYLSDERIAPCWLRICKLYGVGKADDGFCDESKRKENV